MRLNISLSDDNDHHRALEETGFWGRRGAGVLVLSASTGRLLLPLRSSKVQEPHTWGTWGGAIDDGENPAKAAMREMREESGVRLNPTMLEMLYEFHSGAFQYTTFLAVVDAEFKPRLDKETEAANWFELDSLPTALHFGLRAILDDSKAMSLLRRRVRDIRAKILAPFAELMERYQSNGSGSYDAKWLRDAYFQLPRWFRSATSTRFVKSTKNLYRGSDSHTPENFNFLAGKLTHVASFTDNKSVAEFVYGPTLSLRVLAESFGAIMSVAKAVKIFNRLRIPHSVGDDEGEYLVFDLRYRNEIRH